MATVFSDLAILSCNIRQKSSKDNLKFKNSLKDPDIKKLADNYNVGKETFRKLCNSCHVAPERHADNQDVFDNLLGRLPTPSESYFIKYIRDSNNKY
jgi:hypothetical protein